MATSTSSSTTSSPAKKRAADDDDDDDDDGAAPPPSTAIPNERKRKSPLSGRPQKHYSPPATRPFDESPFDESAMTPDELAAWRRERRRVRNKESAAAGRIKTRRKILELETEVEEYRAVVEEMRRGMTGMRARIAEGERVVVGKRVVGGGKPVSSSPKRRSQPKRKSASQPTMQTARKENNEKTTTTTTTMRGGVVARSANPSPSFGRDLNARTPSTSTPRQQLRSSSSSSSSTSSPHNPKTAMQKQLQHRPPRAEEPVDKPLSNETARPTTTTAIATATTAAANDPPPPAGRSIENPSPPATTRYYPTYRSSTSTAPRLRTTAPRRPGAEPPESIVLFRDVKAKMSELLSRFR